MTKIGSLSSLGSFHMPETTLEAPNALKELYDISASHKGLFSRLIERYSDRKINADVRFWLASCIEVFLRGNNQYF